MKQSIVDDIPFTLLDWSDLMQITDRLAVTIQERGEKFARIIAVANGGLTMVRHLADRISLKTISLIQISSYQGVAEHDPEPIILQPLLFEAQGEKLLIFEDIVDTGATLQVMHKYLNTIGVQSYQIATQIEKSHSFMHADYVGMHQDGWIIFPYETRETIVNLRDKWQGSGVSIEEIRARLQQIGFASAEVMHYLD